MRQGGPRIRAHALAHLPQGLIRRHVDAEHLRGDEKADRILQFGPRAIAAGHAHGETALAAQARQQNLPCREQRHERRAAQLRAQRLDLARQPGRHLEIVRRAARLQHGGTGVIGRQVQVDQVVAKMGIPMIEPGRVASGLGLLPLPGGKITILAAQRRQRRGLALRRLLVRVGQVAHEDGIGPGVGDDVVHAPGQHVLARPQPRHRRDQRGFAIQLEGMPGQALAHFAHGGFPQRGGERSQVVQRQREAPGRQHALARLPVVVMEGRAQDVVARDQGRERFA